MFRGAATVAAPSNNNNTISNVTTTRPAATAAVGRLNLLFQQPGGGSRHTRNIPDNELKQKWSAGLSSTKGRELPTSPKTDGPSTPQWKRKQEPEKMPPKEPERKIEPLWKRIREAEGQGHREHQKEQKTAEQPEQPILGRQRPEPLWKKKQETKAEVEMKSNALWKKKEPTESVVQQDLASRQQSEKMEQGKGQEQPGKKLDPLWKRKFESAKTTEPEVKNGFTEKGIAAWKRKTELAEKKEEHLLDTKNEPSTKPVPAWKRKKEPEKALHDSSAKPEEKDADAEKKAKKVKEEETEQSIEEQDESEEEILCPMCSELFDEEEQPPVMLPRCGHTFCRPCLVSIKGKGHFPCPTCRKRHLKPPAEDLPLNTEILSRANAYREGKTGRCKRHEELLLYWCRECQVPLCASCRVAQGHDVVRTKVVLREKRQELKEQGEAILTNVLQEKRRIIDSVTSCSAQLLQVCEASVTVNDSSHDVKEMLTTTRQTADLGFVLNSLQRMKSILGFFSKSSSGASDTDETNNNSNKTPTSSRRRKDNKNSATNTNNKTQDSSDANTTTSENKEVKVSQASMKQEKGIATTVTADTKTLNAKEMRVNAQPRQTMQPPQPLSPTQTPTAGMRGILGPRGGTGGGVGGQVVAGGEGMIQGPLLPMSETTLFPLTCCVYGEDERRARLAWKDGRLHMHALSEHEEAAHFMIKLSVIQSVIPEDNPEVFLEVQAGERNLGRIYIRLWGHLRRAQHFLALCMGTHGPSYRGAKFEEVFSRGLKGECLHAGPYLTPTGGLSAQRVMDGLEWEGQYQGIQRRGLVVGAGSGRPDRDSCFDICTIENPTRRFACPFGEVVSGWDTIEAILEYRPVRAVAMVDVGVVVPCSFSSNFLPTPAAAATPSPVNNAVSTTATNGFATLTNTSTTTTHTITSSTAIPATPKGTRATLSTNKTAAITSSKG